MSEFFSQALDFNLAYKSTRLADPSIRVESTALEIACDDPVPLQTNLSTATTVNVAPVGTLSVDKFTDADLILARLASNEGRVRVIVNLEEPPMLRQNMNWRSAWARRDLQGDISRRRRQVLTGLPAGDFTVRHRFKNLNSFSGTVTSAGLKRLQAYRSVVSIEPVRQLQAHLRQGIDLINAAEARTVYNGTGLAIAIVDTGVDYMHPMLGGGTFPNDKVIGGFDFGDNDADPLAGNAHGTNVAGIAAGDLGEVGDYIGGVASGAKLYALKITAGSSGSATTDDMVAAWDWCVTNQHADPNHPIMVINTSFGGGIHFLTCDGSVPSMTQAANNAAAAGITMLASSGNDGWCNAMAWPACIDNVISVGAVYDAAFGSVSWCVSGLSCANILSSNDCFTGWASTGASALDEVAVYSNGPSFVDVLAPANQATTTDVGGGYILDFGGTSAACPYAAGVVACLQSAAMQLNGFYLTPEEVQQVLIETGDPVTDAKVTITKPRVNLGRAIEKIGCSGSMLLIHNDGEASLEVTDVTTPTWVTLSPAPPYTIPGGSRMAVCVTADSNACIDESLAGQIDIFSNDPNQSPYPGGVQVTTTYTACSQTIDFNNDCDVDLLDFSLFSQQWFGTGCSEPTQCGGTDMNGNGRVDLPDLIRLAKDWLAFPSSP